MKNKLSLIGFLLITLLLTAGMVCAFSAPYPIGGSITAAGFPVEHAEVRVVNLNTGSQEFTTTNDNGYYQVDLPNFDPNYRGGDKIEVTLMYCKFLPYCVVNTVVEGGGSKVSFDVENVNVELPEGVEVIKYTCEDGSEVVSQTSCPTQEPEVITKTVTETVTNTVTIEKVICEDGSEVSVVSDCPEGSSDWWKYVLGVLIAIAADLLAMFGWAKGFTSGLIKYWAKRDPERAAKMLQTALTKAKEGKYK